MNGKVKLDDKSGNLDINLLNYNNNKSSNINLSYSFKYTNSIIKEDVSNSINISNVSSEKYAEIYNNINDRQELNSLHKVYELYKLHENPNYISQSIGYIW